MDTVCAICAYPITGSHHILPRAYGGGDEPANLIALCPNHHAAIHIAITQLRWEFRNQGRVLVCGKGIAPLNKKHRALWPLVYQDAALMDYFNAVVVSRFGAASWPFNLPRDRRWNRQNAEDDKRFQQIEEQEAWNARKKQKGA